jgi:hypothetical protein
VLRPRRLEAALSHVADPGRGRRLTVAAGHDLGPQGGDLGLEAVDVALARDVRPIERLGDLVVDEADERLALFRAARAQVRDERLAVGLRDPAALDEVVHRRLDLVLRHREEPDTQQKHLLEDIGDVAAIFHGDLPARSLARLQACFG